MIRYKCIIVDDETRSIQSLSDFIYKAPNLILAGTYKSSVAALEILNSKDAPEIAFLDIHMPELSGLALAKLMECGTEIIFVSAYPEFALDSYGMGVHAAGYLLKPVSFDTFLETVQHVCGKIARPAAPKPSEPQIFKTNNKGKYISILSQDIVYIEAIGNYVKIFTINNESPKVVYLTLKKAEVKLWDTNLIRVNRSHMINTIYLDGIDGNSVTLKNNKSFMIGPTYREHFQNFISTRLVSSS